MNYIMSSKKPLMTPYEYDLLEGVSDIMIHDSKTPPSKTPDGDKWPRHVAETLGFIVDNIFPVNWDGSGCHILSKMDDEYARVALDHPARRFKFLALLDVAYDHGIVVGIRNEAALLQFYRLIQPMLTLQTDTRFRSEGEDDGWWNGGRAWMQIYHNDKRRQQQKNR